MRNYWLRRSWKLNFTLIEPPPDYFYGRKIRIDYGPYSTEFYCECMNDLRDCHGIDACIEMTQIIVADLEHEKKSHDMDTVDPDSKSFIGSSIYGPRRVGLTVRQRWKILKLIRGLREGESPDKLLA